MTTAFLTIKCKEFDCNLAFFTHTLHFKISAIFPADDPAIAEITGYGLNIRLQRDEENTPVALSITTQDLDAFDGLSSTTAPNGTTVEIIREIDEVVLPDLKPSFAISKLGSQANWVSGRAGMRYRDLIPDRQGGRFIASHIAIPDGGPVADYVHYHQIYFQMIFCYKGWVKVVYEDQGEEFVMEAGDCVLQPPQIRHRVLESSPGLEVIEIGCPAEHITRVDHNLQLPNHEINPERDFSGQLFTRHQSAVANWEPWKVEGMSVRDLGIKAATSSLAHAEVIRCDQSAMDTDVQIHHADLLFWFILDGEMTLLCDDQPPVLLQSGDSVVVPPHCQYQGTGCSQNLQFLAVTLPAF